MLNAEPISLSCGFGQSDSRSPRHYQASRCSDAGRQSNNRTTCAPNFPVTGE